MNLLLDTCAFIWWDSGGGLSAGAATALQDNANRLHLSYASLWEMQLKHQKGKLVLRKSPATRLTLDFDDAHAANFHPFYRTRAVCPVLWTTPLLAFVHRAILIRSLRMSGHR